MLSFKHKPKMGDIIYSLPLIKYLGGGILYLDIVSEHFPGEEEIWKKNYKWLIPLIEIQPYIGNVKIYEGEDFDFDLDYYMDTTHLVQYDEVSIVDNHFIAQNMEPIPYKKWLTAGNKSTKEFIVVANSDNHHDDDVDYFRLLKDKDYVFVGTKSEAQEFEDRSGVKCVKFYETSDALKLAMIINKCKYFIGNQSLPLAIALGLGKKCFVEQSPTYPNCIIGNYQKL